MRLSSGSRPAKILATRRASTTACPPWLPLLLVPHPAMRFRSAVRGVLAFSAARRVIDQARRCNRTARRVLARPITHCVRERRGWATGSGPCRTAACGRQLPSVIAADSRHRCRSKLLRCRLLNTTAADSSRPDSAAGESRLSGPLDEAHPRLVRRKLSQWLPPRLAWRPRGPGRVHWRHGTDPAPADT